MQEGVRAVGAGLETVAVVMEVSVVWFFAYSHPTIDFYQDLKQSRSRRNTRAHYGLWSPFENATKGSGHRAIVLTTFR